MRKAATAWFARLMSPVFSFPPIATPTAKWLLLGSMPGVASLAAQQYYAHPRNAFWPIVAALWPPDMDSTVNADSPYAQRVAGLLQHDVAVWDVLQSCVREGSLDSAILASSCVANDFARFFAAHPQIHTIGFNGAEAERCFKRHVLPELPLPGIRQIRLPSSSPAHAVPLQQKIQQWRELLKPE